MLAHLWARIHVAYTGDSVGQRRKQCDAPDEAGPDDLIGGQDPCQQREARTDDKPREEICSGGLQRPSPLEVFGFLVNVDAERVCEVVGHGHDQ